MNENENTKICPLRAAICYGDSCAWYMQGCRRCALPPLESLSADAEDYQGTGKKALLP